MQSDDSYKFTRHDNTSPGPVLGFPKKTKSIIVEFGMISPLYPHIYGERKSKINSDARLRRARIPCSGATAFTTCVGVMNLTTRRARGLNPAFYSRMCR